MIRRGERDQARRERSGEAREIRRGERDQAWREIRRGGRDAEIRRGERAGEARDISRVERDQARRERSGMAREIKRGERRERSGESRDIRRGESVVWCDEPSLALPLAAVEHAARCLWLLWKFLFIIVPQCMRSPN